MQLRDPRRRRPAAVAVLVLALAASWLLRVVPADGGSGDAIDLVARFPAESLGTPRQDRDPQETAATVRVDDRELVLPFGSRVTYELEIPAFAELQAEKIRPRGTATGRLEVRWQPDGGEERLLCADMDALADSRICIGNVRAETGRLQLAATASRVVDPQIASLILVEPRVLDGASPASPQSVPPVGIVQQAPNVIVLVIDALRADHLGCYGSARAATPNLDRFAAQAVLFANAQAQAPLTNPAVASLFTGLWPQRHRVNDVGSRLPGRARTLAETLSAGGVATAAVVANGLIDSGHGFAQGFEHFKYIRDVRSGEYHARAEDINEAIFDWLDSERRRPLFLYVHTLGPHSPYQPQEVFRSRFAAGITDPELGSVAWQRRLERTGELPPAQAVADVNALYDAEVAENDAAFGELVEGLRRRGLLEETVIIVTADHGEELFDHGGFGHGRHLHAEVLDIPLLIRFPEGRGARRVEQVVEQVDLMATVLELFGLALAGPSDGRSLLPLCGPSPPTDWKNRAVAHIARRGRTASSLLAPPWKLILETREERDAASLYDRSADRGERRDLGAERPEAVDALRSSLLSLLEGASAGLTGPEVSPLLDEETLERLRALGYL